MKKKKEKPKDFVMCFVDCFMVCVLLYFLFYLFSLYFFLYLFYLFFFVLLTRIQCLHSLKEKFFFLCRFETEKKLHKQIYKFKINSILRIRIRPQIRGKINLEI